MAKIKVISQCHQPEGCHHCERQANVYVNSGVIKEMPLCYDCLNLLKECEIKMEGIEIKQAVTLSFHDYTPHLERITDFLQGMEVMIKEEIPNGDVSISTFEAVLTQDQYTRFKNWYHHSVLKNS